MSRAVVPALAGLLTVSAGLAPAQAASPPGWRVTEVFPVSSGLDSVAATGPRDAWTVGSSCGDPCVSQPLLVDRWNGAAWRAVAVPSDAPASVGSAITAASSSADAWVFAQFGADVDYTDALHWTGGAWAPTTQFPAWAAITSAVAPSPADAWAFGQFVYPFAPYAAHYDGTSWSQVAFPITPEESSASSPSNVWVIGQTLSTPAVPQQQVTTMHWDGQSWQQVPLPPITRPAGDNMQPADILAISPDNVWADAILTAGEGVAPGSVLLHWNGKAWSQVTVPYPTYEPNSLAQDGHNGIWLSVYGDATENYSPYLVHDSNGHWNRVAVPTVPGDASTQLSTLSWIPGTRSVWAVGETFPVDNPDGVSQGVILKYGR